MEIRSKYDATRILWEGEARSIKDGVEIAVASGADLYGADLYGADLRGANLRGAYLYGADLYGADLYGADLRGAYLYGADLRGAYLRGADLRGADLRGAYLYGADLYGADLYGADLRGADGVNYSTQPTIVRLPVGDPRGYDCIAQWDGAQWIVVAGCRRFTATEAAEHWGDAYEGDRAIGDRYLFGLGCLTGVEPPK